MSTYQQHVAQLRQGVAAAKLAQPDSINTGKAVFIPTQVQFCRGTQRRVDADLNCALCTTAALARTKTGQMAWNSGSVCQNVSGGDGAVQPNDAFIVYRRNLVGGRLTTLPEIAEDSDRDLQLQIDGLAEWCARTLACKIQILGDAVFLKSQSFAIPWMKAQSDGALFAVYLYRNPFQGAIAHWIYAEKKDGKVTFTDYQTDKQQIMGSGPTTSDRPIGAGGATIVGDYKMVVVALLPDS